MDSKKKSFEKYVCLKLVLLEIGREIMLRRELFTFAFDFLSRYSIISASNF